MAGSTERTSSRRRAWDTAAALLSVLLVTLGTVYLGSNPEGLVWVVQRLAWFPALALALAGLILMAGPARPGRAGRRHFPGT